MQVSHIYALLATEVELGDNFLVDIAADVTLRVINPDRAIFALGGTYLYSVLQALRGGKIEGLWRMIPENFGVVDISESGTTREENELTWLSSILTAQLVLYENPEKMAEDLEFTEQINELKKLLETLRTNQ